MRALILLPFALVAAACVTTPTPSRLARETPIKVAVVVDQPGKLESGEVPDELIAALTEALEARNLKPEFASGADGRLTADRVSSLGQGDALLIEVSAAYYSNLNGFFRWVVSGRVTLSPADLKRLPQSSAFERAVFLRFQHEGADDAIRSAEESLVRSTMYVVDGWLEGHPDARKLGQPAPLPKPGRAPEPEPEPGDDDGANDGANDDANEDDGADDAGDAEDETAKLRRDAALYFAMVDRLKNADVSNDGDVDPSDPKAFHGGDLDGVREQLERLLRLGVSSVWLTPIYSMRPGPFEGHGAFHGYWVRDFTTVEARFGGEAALERLVKALDDKGMGLMLDVVLNHADYNAPLVKARPELFHHEGAITDWNDPVQLVRREVHGLPDFAQEKKATRDFLVRVHADWVRRARPSRIRIDAARHMDPAFLKDFGEAMRAASARPLEVVGEYWTGNPSDLAAKARAAGFDAVFDFPLYYGVVEGLCKDDGDLGAFAAQATLARVYPRGADGLITFVDNHDLPRIATACPGRVEQALAAVLLSRGTPAITWGTEVPLVGKTELEARGDMRFTGLKLEGLLTELLALRRAHPSLTSGPTRIDDLGKRAVVFSRPVDGGALQVAINAGDRPFFWGDRGRLVFSRGRCGQHIAPGAACARLVQGAPPIREGPVPATITVEGPEGLALVGAAPELGGWDPARAPRVEGGALSLALPPGAYECKLVKVSGERAEWESRANRYFLVGRAGGEASFKWQS